MEFKKITSTRPLFLRAFLEKGYTVFYNDADMVWKQDAWTVVDRLRGEKKEAKKTKTKQPQQQPGTNSSSSSSSSSSTNSSGGGGGRSSSGSSSPNEENDDDDEYDDEEEEDGGSVGMFWYDGNSMVCTCLMYLEPSNTTAYIMDRWHEQIVAGSYVTDQHAFRAMTDRPESYPSVRVFRNSVEFPEGKAFPWDHPHDERANRTVVVHNNWIMGKRNKRSRFESAGLWNPSGRLGNSTDDDNDNHDDDDDDDDNNNDRNATKT